MERERRHSTLPPPNKRLSRIFESFLYFTALLFLSLSAASAINRLSMNYSEIQSLGSSCPRLDSCTYKKSIGNRELDSVGERNCACDYLCEEYGDCCIDAADYGNANPVESGWKCRELRQFGGVYMKDRCSVRSFSPEIVHLCEENTEDASDPLRTIPVTDSTTGFTYKNHYCGLCNGNSENLVFWLPRVECPTLMWYNRSRMNLTHEFVFQNLVYDGSSWGVYLDGDNGSLFFHECVIDPVMPPLLENRIRLCRTHAVSSCPSDWKDEEVRAKCRAYTGLRYFHSESYRNVHCAVCNRVNISLLTCQSVRFREYATDLDFRTFEHHAFSLLLDINENKGANVGYVQKCSVGEVFDPFFKKCRSLACLPGLVRRGGVCLPVDQPIKTNEPIVTTTTDDPQPIISLNEDTNVLETNSSERNASYVVVIGEEKTSVRQPAVNETKQPMANLSDAHRNSSEHSDPDREVELNIGKFKDCLLISLEEDDYLMFDNRTIYVPKYDKLYEPSLYFSVNGSVLVCSHFGNESDAKFTPVMGYVTVIGLGVSMLCLLLHSVLFLLVPDLQNLSGKNLLSQCVALFCAYSCYIAGLSQAKSVSCVAVAYLTFYFFQASFFWMNAMAFDVWRTLKMATTELRVTSGKQTKRFLLYSAYSWLVPLLVVSLAAVAEYTDAFPEEYRPRFGQPRCWFKHRRALLAFFAIPLFVVIVSNVILFASSAKMIIMTTKTTVKQQSSSQKRNFTLYLRLFILMGLTWAVGIVAGYVDNEFLWYLFVVLNTFQGLFIFVAFSCTAKVLGYLRNRASKFRKEGEFRSSAVQSTSHENSHSNSTTVLTSVVSSKNKNSKKPLMSKKNSASPTNSSASNSSKR